eukprot:SAG22_NODE_19_length_32182_cov_39.206963_8_plen_36_part_00
MPVESTYDLMLENIIEYCYHENYPNESRNTLIHII